METQIVILICDMRQIYLAELMTKKGYYVRCLDMRNQNIQEEQLRKLSELLKNTEMLILPVPVSRLQCQAQLNEILNKSLENGTRVAGGCFLMEQQQIFERRGISYLDFMKDETVARENAVATAEGVVAELVKKSPYNIAEAKILVSGYGCCGKAIASRLAALGARVTVLARRKEARREAKAAGMCAADFAFAPEEAMGSVMLVNTVPAPVITKLIIRELPRDAYILDIASAPGGTDFDYARECGISADLALGLPGKYAPKESAYIFARAMSRFYDSF